MKKIISFFKKLVHLIFKKQNIIWIILLLAIIVAVMFLKFQKKVDEYKVETKSMYQYFTGFKIEYDGKIQLSKEDDRVTKITFGDDTVSLSSTPLYYVNEQKVLFPQTMSVVKPREGKQFKVNYYTIAYKDLDSYSVLDGTDNTRLTNAVIYDGVDLYFFMDDVTVSFGEESIPLNPLSYISVDTFNHTVEVYSYLQDECKVYENIMDDVIIQNDNYKMNASLDVMYYNDKSRLLIKDLSKLKHLS